MTEKTIDFDNNIRLRIEQDPDPDSPADWDNFGEIAYTGQREVLGTQKVTRERMDEIAAGIASGELIGTPVYAYVHSGATIACGVRLKDKARTWAFCNPFSCPWDSGQSGFVYTTRDKVFEEYGKKRITKAVREAVLQVLAGEVATFDQYLQGDVYGYVVELVTRSPYGKRHVISTEELATSWGLYGMEDAIAEGTSDAQYYVREAQLEADEVQYWLDRGVQTVSKAHT